MNTPAGRKRNELRDPSYERTGRARWGPRDEQVGFGLESAKAGHDTRVDAILRVLENIGDNDELSAGARSRPTHR